jgi:hypothetical protein
VRLDSHTTSVEPELTRVVDVRYLVASKRYEATKEMRTILRLHFEDAFQSPGHVEDVAKRLKTVKDQINATIELLLPQTNTPPACQPSADTSGGARAEDLNKTPRSFDRIWKLEPDRSDQEVINFCSWSAILLHLMVHKAFCVLYHPLFRDPVMASNTSIRTRFLPTVSR